MKKHKCNCSDLLQKVFQTPAKMPRVDRYGNGYVICDPALAEIDGSIEITIVGRESVWKITPVAGK
jgi:hypothetical protein